jgi:hypothetical protein
VPAPEVRGLSTGQCVGVVRSGLEPHLGENNPPPPTLVLRSGSICDNTPARWSPRDPSWLWCIDRLRITAPTHSCHPVHSCLSVLVISSQPVLTPASLSYSPAVSPTSSHAATCPPRQLAACPTYRTNGEPVLLSSWEPAFLKSCSLSAPTSCQPVLFTSG